MTNKNSTTLRVELPLADHHDRDALYDAFLNNDVVTLAFDGDTALKTLIADFDREQDVITIDIQDAVSLYVTGDDADDGTGDADDAWDDADQFRDAIRTAHAGLQDSLASDTDELRDGDGDGDGDDVLDAARSLFIGTVKSGGVYDSGSPYTLFSPEDIRLATDVDITKNAQDRAREHSITELEQLLITLRKNPDDTFIETESVHNVETHPRGHGDFGGHISNGITTEIHIQTADADYSIVKETR